MATMTKADRELYERSPEEYSIKRELPRLGQRRRVGQQEATRILLDDYIGILEVRKMSGRPPEKIAEAERFVAILQRMVAEQ